LCRTAACSGPPRWRCRDAALCGRVPSALGLGLPSFFLTGPATTGLYPLSLHDALPISRGRSARWGPRWSPRSPRTATEWTSMSGDRKSTRLNSSHVSISYAVFCLKKKKQGEVRLLVGQPLHATLDVAVDDDRAPGSAVP